MALSSLHFYCGTNTVWIRHLLEIKKLRTLTLKEDVNFYTPFWKTRSELF